MLDVSKVNHLNRIVYNHDNFINSDQINIGDDVKSSFLDKKTASIALIIFMASALALTFIIPLPHIVVIIVAVTSAIIICGSLFCLGTSTKKEKNRRKKLEQAQLEATKKANLEAEAIEQAQLEATKKANLEAKAIEQARLEAIKKADLEAEAIERARLEGTEQVSLENFVESHEGEQELIEADMNQAGQLTTIDPKKPVGPYWSLIEKGYNICKQSLELIPGATKLQNTGTSILNSFSCARDGKYKVAFFFLGTAVMQNAESIIKLGMTKTEADIYELTKKTEKASLYLKES